MLAFMKLDLMTGGRKLRDVADLARSAEAAGISGMILTEGGRTAYLSAAAAAMATEDFDIGTGIAVAFPRSPMVTASVAWELADATGGRFHLGLGTQVRAHIERRYGVDFDPPGPRLREYVLALRAIFRGFQGTEKLDFHGDYHDLSLLPPMWSPGPIDHPDVPILVAAVGPWMTQMAGEVADGIHVHPFHSPTYLRERLLPSVAQGAANADRDPADIELVIPAFTIVGDTEEEREPLRQQARTQIAFYGSTRNYAFMFDMLGFEGTSARLNEKMKAGDIGGMADLITDEMLDHYAITSTWDDLPGALVDRYGGLAGRVVMYFIDGMAAKDPQMLDRFGEVAKAIADA
jgi:probable F420-dependent oxidoreductase